MIKLALFLMFNTFYKDGSTTDDPKWMRFYLAISAFSAVGVMGLIGFLLALNDRPFTLFGLPKYTILILSFVTYYFTLIRHNQIIDIYDEISVKLAGKNLKKYYIMIWILVIFLALGPGIIAVEVLRKN